VKKKILLVDNDLDCLEIFQYLLDAEGYEVKAVPSPDLVSVNEYDLIILDENLEDQPGRAFCAVLKSNPQTASIPVVLTSTLEDLEEIADGCHAEYILKKPFDIVELETLVSEILLSKN
jgi:two-component system, OmpR family, response regulator VicR